MDSFYDADGGGGGGGGDADSLHDSLHNCSGPEGMAFRSAVSSSFTSSSMCGGGGSDEMDGSSSRSEAARNGGGGDDEEEMSHVMTELNATRRQCKEGQQRVNDLEDQLNSLSEYSIKIPARIRLLNSHFLPHTHTVQENQSLSSRIQSAEVNNEIKSMQEELSILDDVRYGKLCGRCLRSCHDDGDDRMTHDDDMQSYAGTEDGDDNSINVSVATFLMYVDIRIPFPSFLCGYLC